MASFEELAKLFEHIEDDKKQFAIDTIEEYVYFKNQIDELKKLPLIQISPKNPMMQRQTTAGKMIKEYSQIVDAKRNTLLRIINQNENSAADELLAKLGEFE